MMQALGEIHLALNRLSLQDDKETSPIPGKYVGLARFCYTDHASKRPHLSPSVAARGQQSYMHIQQDNSLQLLCVAEPVEAAMKKLLDWGKVYYHS